MDRDREIERENVNKRLTAMVFTISFKLKTTITVSCRSEKHIKSKLIIGNRQTSVHKLNTQFSPKRMVFIITIYSTVQKS